MSFTQLIEFDTTKEEEELRRLMDEWRNALGTETTVTHTTLTRDHKRPGHYVAIVEFSSREEAMRDGGIPQTEEMAHKVRELCEGQPRFIDLEVIEEEDF